MIDGLWHVMILLGERCKGNGLLAEWFGRGTGLWSRRGLLMFRRGAFCVDMEVTACSFGMGEFLHEGLESCIDRFCDGLFCGGFNPMLLGFQVRFNISDCGRGSQCCLGKSVGGVFQSGDAQVNSLDFRKVFLLEKGDLLLEIGCGLNELFVDLLE